jgi:hypothetical protein
MVILSSFWYYLYIQKGKLPEELYFLEGIKLIGAWGWWLLIPSPIVFIFGIFYFSDQIVKRRKFKRLLSITSKAMFIKNLPELEDLVLDLPEKYRKKVEERKSFFKL